MNATKQAAWLLTILCVLACSGWYFTSSSSLVRLDEHTLTSTTDTIIHQLTILQFDIDGHLTHYLHTPLMQHIPLNNTHQLKTPHVIVNQLQQPAWEIHAEEAIALHGGEQITFNKHVIIHQNMDAHTPEKSLRTEQITYFPKSKFATTHKEITFDQAKNRVQSTGMQAYLGENRVKLLSNARGVYETAHG